MDAYGTHVYTEDEPDLCEICGYDKSEPASAHTVTVIYGSASHETAEAGDTVKITADQRSGYTFEKSLIVALLCLYKMFDGLSDVYEGQFQQQGVLHIAGKAMLFRALLSGGADGSSSPPMFSVKSSSTSSPVEVSSLYRCLPSTPIR